jgi:hypothetical protein
MTATLERPPDSLETSSADGLQVLTPAAPPAVTPDVARVLLRLLRTAMPDLDSPSPGGTALGA